MGIGFAIPVSLARQVMEQIIETGSRHARLDRRRGAGHHARARRVLQARRQQRRADRRRGARRPGRQGGREARATFWSRSNGKPVPDSSAMLNVVAEAQPGKVATLKLLRNSNRWRVKLTVGKRPKPQPRPRRAKTTSAARRAHYSF